MLQTVGGTVSRSGRPPDLMILNRGCVPTSVRSDSSVDTLWASPIALSLVTGWRELTDGEMNSDHFSILITLRGDSGLRIRREKIARDFLNLFGDWILTNWKRPL